MLNRLCFLIFIFVGCNSDDIDNGFSLDNITGKWLRAFPIEITSYVEGSTVPIKRVIQEEYHFSDDTLFTIYGLSFFKPGTKGAYIFDKGSNEIYFETKLISIIINGSLGTILGSEHKWKWIITDYSNDSLYVFKSNFNKATNQYENSSTQTIFVNIK